MHFLTAIQRVACSGAALDVIHHLLSLLYINNRVVLNKQERVEVTCQKFFLSLEPLVGFFGG